MSRREAELRWANHQREHDTADRALSLQAREYERRLESLNHAHEQAVEAQARTVPREIFDAFIKENDSRREALVGSTNTRIGGVEDQIGVERSARIRNEGSLGTWRGIAGFLGASGVIGIILGVIAVFGPAHS